MISEVQGTCGNTVKGVTTNNLNGGYQSVIANKNEQTVLCPSKLSFKAKEELIDGDSSSIQLSGKTVTALGSDVTIAGPKVTISCTDYVVNVTGSAKIDYGTLEEKIDGSASITSDASISIKAESDLKLDGSLVHIA
jgi:hypothetical protein